MKKILLLLSVMLNQGIYAQNYEALSIFEIDSIAESLYSKHDYPTAFIAATKSLEKAKAMQVDSLLANSLNNLAFFNKILGNYTKAVSLYLQSLPYREKSHGILHSEYLNTLNNLGQTYTSMDLFDQAASTFEKYLGLCEQRGGKQSLPYSYGLNNLADVYERTGQFEKAEPLLLQSMAIRKKLLGSKHPSYAAALESLAVFYTKNKRFVEAEPLYLECLHILKEQLPKTEVKYAQTLGLIAVMYKEMQEFAKAKEAYNECIRIQKNVFGEKHPLYLTSLGNLAVYYRTQALYDDAEKLYLKILNILKNNKKNSIYASNLNNLAFLYRTNKKYAAAEPLFIQVVEIWEEIHGSKHPIYAGALNNLSELYLNMGRLDDAMNYCMKGIVANCNEMDSLPDNLMQLTEFDYFDQTILFRALTELILVSKKLYQTTGEMNELTRYFQACELALAFSEKIKNGFIGTDDKLRLLNQSQLLIGNGIEAAFELSRKNNRSEIYKAFSFAELNKSILLADATKAQRARAIGDIPDSLAAKESLLQNSFDRLKKQLLSAKATPKAADLHQELNEVNLEIIHLKKVLEENYPKYYKLRYADITADVKETQQHLDKNTAFLEYFIADSLVYLFCLTKSDFQLHPIKIDKSQFVQKVADLRKTLSDYEFIKSEPDKAYMLYVESAYWFYQFFLAPALQEMPAINSLIIVPDAELGHLPYEAFLTDEIKEQKPYSDLPFLLKKYKVSYNYSATLWKENIKAVDNQKNRGRMLAAAASYRGRTQIDSLRAPLSRAPELRNLRDQLQDLPAAKEEVAALSKFFVGDFLFDNDANEQKFKAIADKYDIIHLAMHGLLNVKHPILSSMAFTENSDSLEDNFLQAYEISQMKLNAQLVVLSACETGYGKFVQGEGVMSLARSFMYAGVPSLVVSMWQVNDASTSLIMQAFYKNLAKGMDKAEALRQAKLAYIGSVDGMAAHPAFWAPFIQLGDSRPIEIRKKGTINGLSIALFALGGLFLTGLIVVVSRKFRKG